MILPTGKRRYRVEQDGCLVLQVEERPHFATKHGPLPVPDAEPSWRDARLEDLTVHDIAAR
jgi:hypothetical protein